MKPFDRLLVWQDPVARSGPENMAIDELLLRAMATDPVLRLYGWKGEWASVGYFGDLEAARVAFGQDVSLVKRWTGGGMVDHRDDVTYSLMIPRAHRVAAQRGAGSYRDIHRAVVGALNGLDQEARLVEEDSAVESAQCFERPVAWDVVDSSGNKRAGAGQRRLRSGLLHQGSVTGVAREVFAEQLVTCLATAPEPWDPPEELLEKAESLAEEKYAREG